MSDNEETTTAEEAREQLGYAGRVYLEAGRCPDPVPSTIVDVTGSVPRVLRAGAIPVEKLRDVVPDIQPAETGPPVAGSNSAPSARSAEGQVS